MLSHQQFGIFFSTWKSSYKLLKKKEENSKWKQSDANISKASIVKLTKQAKKQKTYTQLLSPADGPKNKNGGLDN